MQMSVDEAEIRAKVTLLFEGMGMGTTTSAALSEGVNRKRLRTQRLSVA